MRTCRSILAIILATSFISCQSVPQSPVRPGTQPMTVPEAQTPTAPEYSPPPAPAETPAQARPPEKAEVSVSIASKIPPPKKVSPIKPVISPVESGLLGPQTQEVATGAAALPSKEKQRIVLNFEKADITEVTNQIFSDQLKLNYVMDQNLQGRISMYIEGEYDNEEILQMVTRAYAANGVSIIPRKGFYFVQASQKTGGGDLPVATEQLLKSSKERPLIVIYRLRFMDPKQAANLVTPFLTPGRKITTEPATNSLIFVDETDNARSLVNLLKTIDINILQEVSMEIVPLNNIAPQDAVQGMESLMGKLGGFKESALKNSLALMPLNNFGGVLVMAQKPGTAQIGPAMDTGYGCAGDREPGRNLRVLPPERPGARHCSDRERGARDWRRWRDGTADRAIRALRNQKLLRRHRHVRHGSPFGGTSAAGGGSLAAALPAPAAPLAALPA